jgi:hypothetical protein
MIFTPKVGMRFITGANMRPNIISTQDIFEFEVVEHTLDERFVKLKNHLGELFWIASSGIEPMVVLEDAKQSDYERGCEDTARKMMCLP